MFSLNRRAEAHPLDKAIASLIDTLNGFDEDTEEYARFLSQTKTLMELRAKDQEIRSRRTVSADQVAGIAANLLGIFAIMSFEKTNVITTKAFGFIPKIGTGR